MGKVLIRREYKGAFGYQDSHFEEIDTTRRKMFADLRHYKPSATSWIPGTISPLNRSKSNLAQMASKLNQNRFQAHKPAPVPQMTTKLTSGGQDLATHLRGLADKLDGKLPTQPVAGPSRITTTVPRGPGTPEASKNPRLRDLHRKLEEMAGRMYGPIDFTPAYTPITQPKPFEKPVGEAMPSSLDQVTNILGRQQSACGSQVGIPRSITPSRTQGPLMQAPISLSGCRDALTPISVNFQGCTPASSQPAQSLRAFSRPKHTCGLLGPQWQQPPASPCLTATTVAYLPPSRTPTVVSTVRAPACIPECPTPLSFSKPPLRSEVTKPVMQQFDNPPTLTVKALNIGMGGSKHRDLQNCILTVAREYFKGCSFELDRKLAELAHKATTCGVERRIMIDLEGLTDLNGVRITRHVGGVPQNEVLLDPQGLSSISVDLMTGNVSNKFDLKYSILVLLDHVWPELTQELIRHIFEQTGNF